MSLYNISDNGSKRSRSVHSDISDSRGVSPESDSLFVGQNSKRIATESNSVISTPHQAVQAHDKASTTTSVDSVVGNSPAASTRADTEVNVVSAASDTAQPHKDATSAMSVDRAPKIIKFTPPQLDKDGRVPGYDANKEDFPICAFYCPAFALAEGDATRACDLVMKAYAETVKADGYYNEQMENVCGSSGRLAEVRDPSNLYRVHGPIAIMGPAASGKSSATNSIMGKQKVAFEHDGDDRGTYLVHEYCLEQADQTFRYRVVATYFSNNDIMSDIKSYRKDINSSLFDDDDESSDDNEESEGALEQKKKTALCFFTDLLAHRKEFQTDELTEKYFEDHGDDTEDAMCDQLYHFVLEFIASRKNYVNGEERYNVNTEKELQHIFRQVCRPSKVKARGKQPKEGSPWPILRKIVVHQSVRLLDAGVVLADTPGVNDQNLAVVQNTKRYLRNAGTILIFLSYKRIETNLTLDNLLREGIALGKDKVNDIRLVVTMIDEMKALDEEELDAEDRAKLKTAQLTLRRLTSEIKEAAAAKRQAKGTDRYEALDDQLEALEFQGRCAANAVKQTNIEIRCRDIRSKLKDRIKKIDKSRHAPELPISFISNTEYQLHVAGYELKDGGPFLDLEGTGIPRLRRDLLAIPQDGKLQTLQGLANNALPNILRGINGITSKTKLERVGEVNKTIQMVLRGKEKNHAKPAASAARDIHQAFEKRVITLIKNNLSDWKDESQMQLTKWAEAVKPMTFKCLCARNGEWEGHKTGNHKWNSDLVKISALKLVAAFNKLERDLDGFKKDVSFGIQELFGRLCTVIGESADAQGTDLEPFFEFVRGIGREVVDRMDAEFDDLKLSIGHICHLATLDVEDGHFAKGMSPAYNKATLLSSQNVVAADFPPTPVARITVGKRKLKAKKPTITAARVNTILKKLRGETGGEESIFLTVGRTCKELLTDLTKAWEEQCGKITKEGVKKIVMYFENHFQEGEVKEEENPVAVEKIKKAVEEAMEIVQGPMKQHLAASEAYAKV